MADDVQIRPGGGTHPRVLTDEVPRPGGTTAHVQRVRLDGGPEGQEFALTGDDGLVTERTAKEIVAILGEMNEKLQVLVEVLG